LIAW